LTLIEQSAPMPSAEARAAVAKGLADPQIGTRCSAVVFEGEGFRSAAVRSVVSGLTLLAKPPYEHKIFANIGEASIWLAATAKDAMGWSVTSLEVRDAASDLRAQVAAARGR
ncbi:MAG: hypothetical protein AAB426_10415, partial [Myxococcota bacterium]